MPPKTPTELIQRIASIDWSQPPKQRRSQALLVQEFLRRAALWSEHLPGSGWPFYDYAEELNPEVRASSSELRELENSLPVGLSVFVRETCKFALHFCALQQHQTLHNGLPNPFDPIILVFERGSEIRRSEGGHLDVDFLSVRIKNKTEWLLDTPVVGLSVEKLNAIDAADN